MYIDLHICLFLFRCVEIFFFSHSLVGLNVPSSHVAARGFFLEGDCCVLSLSLSLAIVAVHTAEHEPPKALKNE